MTAPALWPAELPLRGQVRGVSGQRRADRYSFEPEDGIAIERPSSTAAILTYQMQMPAIRYDLLDVFDSFYTDTLAYGSQWFAWVHPRSMAIRRVKIGQSPADQHASVTRWRLQFQLTVIDVTPSWAGYLTTVNGYMQIVDQPAWDAL